MICEINCSKRNIYLCLKLFFFQFCLSTLNTIIVWYMSKCGYVFHRSRVSHEVSRSMLKDRKLLIMQAQALVLVFDKVDCYSEATSKKLV